MPSHEEHCQDSLKRYSKRFDELHRWMDEPSTVLGRDHRIHRHDPVTTPLIAKKIFGELADQACLDHIRLDELEQRRSKRKKSKEGYWKTRKYRRISVEKDIHGYWSDEFLYNMIENCNETSYTKNQDYLRKRDKGLVATLFLTGGRVREVLMLKKDNFDFENEEAQRSKAFLVKKMIVLKRYRKGQKSKPIRETRTFPIWYDDPIVEYLLEWLDETEGYLFPTKEGTDHMTETRAYQIIRELGKRLHPPYHITPQCFREQRKYHLAEKKGFVRYDIQAYLKLERTPTINGHREIWQNLLNVASPPKQEKVYEKRPYDAYKDIRNIVISARKEVDIIDPFVDEKIFKLYLEDIQPNVNIKLITKNMYGKFREVAKRFKVQKPSFEIRVSNEVHDRYLIIDDRVWVIGQSLKDAGMKPLYIIELDDKKRVLDLFQKLWSRAKKELS